VKTGATGGGSPRRWQPAEGQRLQQGLQQGSGGCSGSEGCSSSSSFSHQDSFCGCCFVRKEGRRSSSFSHQNGFSGCCFLQGKDLSSELSDEFVGSFGHTFRIFVGTVVAAVRDDG
jgi:hypothetical protein